jgi:hypothetical protein
MVPKQCVRQLHDCGYDEFILSCRKNAQPEATNTVSNVYNHWIIRSCKRACHVRQPFMVSGTGRNLNGATEPFILCTCGRSREEGRVATPWRPNSDTEANEPTLASKPELERRAGGERERNSPE